MAKSFKTFSSKVLRSIVGREAAKLVHHIESASSQKKVLGWQQSHFVFFS